MYSNFQAADTARPTTPAADALPRLQRLFGFGGAKARYKDHPGRVIRCMDPFSGNVEAFKSPLKYENWLLRRFDPQVDYLNASGDTWAILAAGEQIQVKPQLVWAHAGQRGLLEIVEEPGRPIAEGQARALQLVARAHQMRSSIRRVHEIRDSLRLLELLDRIRQCMALHYTDLREEPWTERIAEHVNEHRRYTRGDLLAELLPRFPGCTEQLVDSALFWLRQHQHVIFDIEGGAYGNATVISC